MTTNQKGKKAAPKKAAPRPKLMTKCCGARYYDHRGALYCCCCHKAPQLVPWEN